MFSALLLAATLHVSTAHAASTDAPADAVLRIVNAGRTFKSGDQIAVFDVPRLERVNGTKPAWLADWNAEAERTLYGLENGQTVKNFAKAIPGRFKEGDGVLRGEYVGSSYRVTWNHGAFLAIELCSEGFGAYPSTSCEERRVRGDTGAAWSWDDAFLRDSRPAFLDACAKALPPALETQRKEWVAVAEDIDVSAVLSEYPDLEPKDCTGLPFKPAADGNGVTFNVDPDLPHAIQALAWSFTVPAKDIAAFLAPEGPLGALK